MASNLASPFNLGVHSASIVRMANLDTDCSPKQGTDNMFVTAGLVTLSGTPSIEEGTAIEPKTAAGDYGFRVKKKDRLKGYDLTGEFIFHDHEAMQMMFSGSLVLGKAGSAGVGKVIGHAMPNMDDGLPQVGVYLEVIQLVAYEDLGECAPVTTGPYAMGTIFGRATLRPGDSQFTEDASAVTFTGTALENPNLFDGPWNDWPGTVSIARSPKIEVFYTKAQYDVIAAAARAGLQSGPTAS